MATLPPPSFDPQALLPMPRKRLMRDSKRTDASRLVGAERALLSDKPSTGISMLSLRSGGSKKKRR